MSIKDVAARVGVSFQTAGKVLNGKGSVSAETRARIHGAAEALGYVPNAIARGLVTRSTCTVGLIAPDFGDSVLAQFVVGAEREARRQGLCVVIGSVSPDGSDGERYLRMLIERRVDGILLAAPVMETDARVGEIVRGRIPAVSLHRVVGGGVTVVGSSQSEIGALPTRHLIALGHRRIGTLTGRRDRLATHGRVKGYRQALESAGIPFDPDLVVEGDWLLEGAYRATRELLARAPDVTAIVSQTDVMAIGALKALHELGRRVPDDCVLVGCDDQPIAEFTIPPLTTVRVPFRETGEMAMRLLVEQIGHPAQPPRRVLLPVELVVRASCGAAALTAQPIS